MAHIDRLTEYFLKFPGVGPRQARRYAFHILTMTPAEAEELARTIGDVRSHMAQCASCQRYFESYRGETICGICAASNRDRNKLLVVAFDSDILAIERSGVYDGLYFVLGGTVPLLNSEATKKIRGGRLKASIEARLREGLREVILAFAVNPDGENTARFVESIIAQIDSNSKEELQVSQLGRGLSTGSELEYADPDTITNALKNRA